MEKSILLGICLAVLASTNMNVGKGIQKWKVKVFKYGRKILSLEHIIDFMIWCFGLLLTTSATPLFSLALKFTDKSSLVSSFNGVGLIGLVLFAWLVLKEKIGWQELVGSALVLSGTTMMGYFDNPIQGDQEYKLINFLLSTISILIVFVPLAIFSWKTNRLYGFSFGAIPGILIGISIILGDMALVKSGNDFVGQLKNPYPYIAIFSGISALIVTQLAFWRAKAIVVVPTINSFIILTPVVIEYFTFGTILQKMQYFAVVTIIIGVVLITGTERQEVKIYT